MPTVPVIIFSALAMLCIPSLVYAQGNASIAAEKNTEINFDQRFTASAIAVCDGAISSDALNCRGGSDRQTNGSITIFAMAAFGWKLVAVIPDASHSRLRYFFQR